MHFQKPKLLPFAAAISLVFILFIFTTLPSWRALWALWFKDGSSYSHGPLIVAVCVWLIYECWGQLQTQQHSKIQLPLALFFGAGASAIWSLGYLTGIALLFWLSLPIMVTALCIAYSRYRVRLASFAPGFALFFAVPLWELLVPPLQDLAVTAVSVFLQVLGLPAHINGIEVSIPGGRFIVEGGCSGVRYLLVSVALTSLWSFLHLKKTTHRALLIGFSIALSILSNWVRIFIIIIIGYVTKMKSSVIYDHEYFGWVIFAITLIPICGLAFWLERRPQIKKQAILANPVWDAKKVALYLVIVSIMPLLSQAYVAQLPHKEPPLLQQTIHSTLFSEPQQQASRQFDLNTGQRTAVLGGWKPQFPGIDTWQRYEYQPSRLQLLVGHISKQSQTQELFSAGNSFDALNPSVQWRQSREGNYITLQNIYGQRWIAKLFYVIGGEFTNEGLSGKISQLKNTIQGRVDGQLFVVGFLCQTNCVDEKSSLQKLDSATVQSWLRKEP